MSDISILEHDMSVIMLANPSDKESINQAQEKVLDALIARAAEDTRLRQSPDYDGRQP